MAPEEAGCVRWFTARATALIIAKISKCQPNEDDRERRQRSQNLDFFTSATLGGFDDRLSWFTEPCGLDQAKVMRVGNLP
jgi:ATP-dependent DNA helicase DinG